MSSDPKSPPYSIEAEQSVLGGLMLDNRAWNDVAEQLSENDFYRADHQLIWRAISDLTNAAKPCDFVTLTEYLKSRNLVEEAGGISYLGSLASDTPSAANVMAYAEIVRERSVLRQLVGMGGDIAEMGYRPEGRDTATLIDDAERRVFKLRETGARARSDFVGMPEVLKQVFSRIETVRQNPLGSAGLTTGFTEFDAKTTGLGSGDLMILAARPSMGKCLSEDAELVLDDGSVATIGELFRRRDSRIATLRPDLKLDRASPGDYVDDGHKPVFEVTTRLGRRVETTAPHPFLSIEGWKPLSELKPGDHIAVPRTMPVFGDAPMRECEIKLLAYLIGDGGLTGSSPRFTTTNPAIERDFVAAVEAFGGCACTVYRPAERAPSFVIRADASDVPGRRAAFAAAVDGALIRSGRPARAVAAAVGVSPASVTHWRQGRGVPSTKRLAALASELRVEPEVLDDAGARRNVANPISAWLRRLDLDGHGAGSKKIPASVFRLPREQLALFLRHLFATDGWATLLASGQSQIGYATICEPLARQIVHLLLRFGVIAKLRLRWVRYRDSRRPCWQIDITDSQALLRFVDEIGIFGKEAAVERVRAAVTQRREQTNTDLVPKSIWPTLERAKGAMSWAELARRAGVNDSNLHVGKRGLSRQRLARFAMVLNDPGLATLAGSDVYWDRIESIVPKGERQVYDLVMPETHNFVANDVCVHNTSFAVNIAEHVAFERKQPVAIFSMEMSAEQIGFRIISSRSGIPLQKLRSGDLNDAEMDQLTWTVGRLREAPLYIDEQGGLSPQTLRAKARRLALRRPLALMVVDYIQLMSVPALAGKRVEEVSEISRQLKALAKELNIPIIALSQLNRGLENREDKRPRMADLRECVAGETLVCLADGRRVPIRELVGTTPEVWALDASRRLVRATSDLVWSVGHRKLHRVELKSGLHIRATAEHRLLSNVGWKTVSELAIGEWLAVVKNPEANGPNAHHEPKLDRIVKITDDGEEEVFDITVPGPANWLADGIVSHNSGGLEQDADLIVFIFREWVYDKNKDESAAEIIIAKQRNGSTGSFNVQFIGPNTKFDNPSGGGYGA